MRTTKELLELMLINISLMGDFGLCALIAELYRNRQTEISYDEYSFLRTYVKWNRPKNLHTLFGSVFYWTKGRKLPRIKWLKKHIKINV